jgi:hypothetical protein
MADNIVPFEQRNQAESPFDSIMQRDASGIEFWSARDLMGLLGYAQWRRFDDSVERAMESLKATGQGSSYHIATSGKLIEVGKGATRKVLDYRLSRMGCYMVAMNGDPRKPEIASAQSYFAIKTREAEVVIPVQNERIQLLMLENENLRLKHQMLDRADLLKITAPALAEAIICPGVKVVEKESFIDRTVMIDRLGSVVSRLDGIGITQVQKQFGFKTTKAAWDWLETIGYGKTSDHWSEEMTAHKTAKLDRSVMAELKSKFTQRYGDRQKLLGE